jgi:large subunit ribosomal protein L19
MKPGQIMQTLEQEEINAVKERTNKRIPEIHVGDTVKVGVKIIEGGKERVQPYEGTVIAMRNGGINETITVRKIFQGVGVERVFLLHSPRIDTITVIRKGRVRRAKLFYLRDRVGKSTRVKQRFDRSLSAMRDDQKDD